jgi:hypothetical protein
VTHDRVYAYVLSALLLGAVAYPLLPTSLFPWAATDGFPLSTYPMFSRKRPTVVSIDHVVAIDSAGTARVVPPSVITSGEVMQAKVLISDTVRRGRRAARQLCIAVAERIRSDASWAGVVTVEVRRDRFDVARYFAVDTKPLRSRVHARCPVGEPSK